MEERQASSLEVSPQLIRSSLAWTYAESLQTL
jgi:hypothetical protein